MALEGKIGKAAVLHELSRGRRAAGDLIPWTVSQQFQDENFPQLSGARVVRIAVHPSYQGMGYGSRALELLTQYYEGMFATCTDSTTKSTKNEEARNVGESPNPSNKTSLSSGLESESIEPRTTLPPLLHRLAEREAERLNWIGTSFGLTPPLLKFWKRAHFVPVYLRQTENELTGEHSCIMLRYLNESVEAVGKSTAPELSHRRVADPSGWLRDYFIDFRRRFLSLLGFEFRSFSPSFAVNVLTSKSCVGFDELAARRIGGRELELFLSKHDMHRLGQYAASMVDYHLITDLIPSLTRLLLLGRLGNVHLATSQSMILIGMGLQHKSADDVAVELGVPTTQLLGMFNKTIRKLVGVLNDISREALDAELAVPNQLEAPESMRPLAVPLAEELRLQVARSAQKQVRV